MTSPGAGSGASSSSAARAPLAVWSWWTVVSGGSVVATTGYTGFLAGPPLVGLLAEVSSLRASFALVGVLCLGAAAQARSVRDDPAAAAPA